MVMELVVAEGFLGLRIVACSCSVPPSRGLPLDRPAPLRAPGGNFISCTSWHEPYWQALTNHDQLC